MTKKILIPLVIVAVAAAAFLVITSGSVEAKRVRSYELQRAVDLDDQTIKQKLMEGWALGGVYRDCGEGSGEVVLTGGVSAALLPFYEQLLEQNKKDILTLLDKQFSAQKARQTLKKIVAGKDKLTNYGDKEEYQSLQAEFDQLQLILAEIKEIPPSKGIANLNDLVARLEKFAASGTVGDINAAKSAILAIQTIIEKQPQQLVFGDVSTAENIDKLEKLRKAVKGSLSRIEQLGGSGCRMTYVFYKQKR